MFILFSICTVRKCNFILFSPCLHFTGIDVAGEVAEVGPAVKKFKPGDKVVAIVHPFVMLTLHVLHFIF